jgi:hypothetical protein
MKKLLIILSLSVTIFFCACTPREPREFPQNEQSKFSEREHHFFQQIKNGFSVDTIFVHDEFYKYNFVTHKAKYSRVIHIFSSVEKPQISNDHCLNFGKSYFKDVILSDSSKYELVDVNYYTSLDSMSAANYLPFKKTDP